MCMTNEAVDELHGITSAIKAEQERRDEWMKTFDAPMPTGSKGPDTEALIVTRAEAAQIFAQRISAHEAKLEELGWRRTIRVESEKQSDKSMRQLYEEADPPTLVRA